MEIYTIRWHNEHDIKRILTISDFRLKITNPNIEEHMNILMDDEGHLIEPSSIAVVFEEIAEMCLRFIHDAMRDKKTILVHCACGINRSPSLVICYLMLSRGLSLEKACDLVSKKRSLSCPNKVMRKRIQRFCDSKEGRSLAEFFK